MNWNTVDLSVRDIYGRLNIDFTPVFKNNVKYFKKMGYKRILDIGSGYGKHSIYLSKNNFDVTSVDINVRMLECLREYIDRNHISNINLMQADINELPFKSDIFDVIICSSVIHHQNLEGVKKSISEMYRVLKKDGCIVVDFMSVEDDSFGLGEEVEKNTFVGSREGEEDIPHYYTDIDQLNILFKSFRKIEIIKNEYHINIDLNNTIKSRMLDVVGYK